MSRRTVSVDGAPYEWLSYDGKFAVLRGPKAYPPGAPLTLLLQSVQKEYRFEGRALGSKRVSTDDSQTPQFEVKLRFISMSREHRAALESWLASAQMTAEH